MGAPSNLDPERAIETMQAGTGTEQILDDVASALASGVEYVPTLFVNEERYGRELDSAALVAALDSDARGRHNFDSRLTLPSGVSTARARPPSSQRAARAATAAN